MKEPDDWAVQVVIDALAEVVDGGLAGPASRESTLADLGLDSLDLMSVVLVIEQRGGPLDDASLDGCETVADVAAVLRSNAQATPSGGEDRTT